MTAHPGTSRTPVSCHSERTRSEQLVSSREGSARGAGDAISAGNKKGPSRLRGRPFLRLDLLPGYLVLTGAGGRFSVYSVRDQTFAPGRLTLTSIRRRFWVGSGLVDT
jgi:hypothetical protein